MKSVVVQGPKVPSIKQVPFRSFVVVSLLFSLFLASFSSNPGLTLACMATLTFLVLALWRPGEPPILFFAAGYQWAQVSAKVFHANYRDVPISELYSLAPDMVGRATLLSLAGLVVLAAGMWMAVRHFRAAQITNIHRRAETLSLDRVFIAYLVVGVASGVLSFGAWYVLALSQILLAIAAVKWVLFFLLSYLVFRRWRRLYYVPIAFVLEIVSGIGFFAGWQTVFFVCAIALMASKVSNRRLLWVVSILAVLLLSFALAWTGIKREFRAYLNQGSGEQVTLRSPAEMIGTFASMVSTLEANAFDDSVDNLLERLAYVDFFAAILSRVPAHIPHTDGALWGQAVLHVLTPRLLFPGKDVLPSDSQMTREYTGLPVSDFGTSISMGYLAETYVDFGAYLMFVPIAMLGMAWGGILRYFMAREGMSVMGYAFATTVLIHAAQFEITSIKLVGSVLMKFIVLALVSAFASEPLLRALRSRGPGGR
ncbi:MAG TPA: hypothetical protein VM240_08175 [Verrucomicrobiae bacterium]|nr:hypothetical protein [Verrucomicrobiae bacterium]